MEITERLRPALRAFEPYDPRFSPVREDELTELKTVGDIVQFLGGKLSK